MSEKSERIDLNSDVVLSESESEVNGVNGFEAAAAAAMVLDSSLKGEANKVMDFRGEYGLAEDGGEARNESLKESEVADEVNADEEMGDLSSKQDGEERSKDVAAAKDETTPFLESSPGCAGKNGASLACERNAVEDRTLKKCTEVGVASALNEAPLSSLKARPDIESHKEERITFEADKGKAFDEMERNQSVELGRVDETLDKGTSFAINSSSKLEDTSHSQSLEALRSVKDIVQPQSLGLTEFVKPLTDAVTVGKVKTKVDPYESWPQRDCETAASDGLQNGALDLEVHLEAQTKENPPCAGLTEIQVAKSSGNESNLFNIVIDLNPRRESDKKVKSAASKPEFGIGDLIWGKVRSHPWWPGQICDPSSSSRKAKKYFKRDSYLVAYFGDHTFAWNEASRIKPFVHYFSQMENHSNTEDFHYAIACALDEVSRRVEFGLACSCTPEEEYAKLKTQIIINAGIQDESCRRDGGDSYLTVTSFEPSKLVHYIKELAQVPYNGTDRLELAVARSQLLAFYRRKGYSELPEFNVLAGLLENDVDISPSGEKKHCNDVSGAIDPEHKDDGLVSEKRKSRSQRSSSSRKRKLTSEESEYPSKKEKSLSVLMAEKRARSAPTSQNSSESKSTSKKRKAGDAMLSDHLPAKETKVTAKAVDKKSQQPKQAFRVGESIRRVASQLNGSSPIVKNGDGVPKSSLVQTKSKEKFMSAESKTGKLVVEKEHSSDEMLSQLFLAAGDPMSGSNFSMITFFSEFRDSISLDLPSSEDDEQSLEHLFGEKTGKKSANNGRKANRVVMNELPLLESMKESYWSKRIIRSNPEPEDGTETRDTTLGTSEKETGGDSATESQTALELDSKQHTLKTEAQNPVDHLNDSSPTALILNFTDLDSVPSENELNKIFSRYGPLKESETEVFKKSSRARVVFRRRSDAETAFSSAGKYSTFGPSLVSYRLKYLQSSPGKTSPNTKKRSKTDADSAEDNAK